MYGRTFDGFINPDGCTHPRMCMTECMAGPSMALLIQMAFQKPYLVHFLLESASPYSLKCHAEAAHDYILNL